MADNIYYLRTRDVRGLDDAQLRGASFILSRNGYPAELVGCGESWEYRSPKPVDDKTVEDLKAIGVGIDKLS